MILPLLLAACIDAGDPPPPSPARTVAYHLSVVGDPGDLAVTIDGAPAMVHDCSFAGAELADAEVVIELADASGLIVDEVRVAPGALAADCRPGAVPTTITEDVCVLGHGEVRYASTTVEFAEGGCMAHGSCLAECSPPDGARCAADQRCTSTLASLEPMRSRVECVDPGWRSHGQVCSWTPRADGRLVDDCAAGLICHRDRCKPLCRPGGCSPNQTCAGLPGHAPEIAVCQNAL